MVPPEVWTSKALPLFNVSKEEWENLKRKKIKLSETDILKKIEERTKAKNDGDYSLADKIRDELLKEGILIEDQKDKTIWKYKWVKIKYIYLILL